MKITFKRDYTTREENPQEFKSGESVELPEASALHMINRGVAEPAKAGATKKAAEKKTTAGEGNK